ncbi:UDP-N-acetylglucosamine 2-epimerase [Candidatus Uhrbacteria bacterium]|nr:UDP-N-acetylglucosamine 2-epimerase [Candidatus Uhrbacteria bacterium]
MIQQPLLFNATERKDYDEERRVFADSWFLTEDKDFTKQKGISYGSLLRLPIFLSPELTNTSIPLGVLNIVMRTIYESIKLLFQIRLQNTTSHQLEKGSRFVFLIAKHTTHGAIAKTLDPIIQSLTKKGESVQIWTFDETQLKTLKAQYPKLLCQNLGKASLSIHTTMKLMFMFAHAMCKQLRTPPNSNRLNALRQLIYHAPKLASIHSALDDRLDKDVIVISATEMHPYERLVFSVAQQKNVPTVLIQHGITDNTIKNQMVNTPSIASHMCVWGEMAKDYFLNHGVEEQRIFVTGSPAIDPSVHTQKQFVRTQTLTKFRLPDKKFIVFSGQNFDRAKNTELCTMTLKAFKDLLGTGDHRKLLITPHPAKSLYTTEDFYKELVLDQKLKLGQDVFIRSAKAEIEELVELSDVLITSSSTLHIEALLRKKLLILLNIDQVPDMEAVINSVALPAHTQDELLHALISTAQPNTQTKLHSGRTDFLREYTSFPQHATANITRILLQI